MNVRRVLNTSTPVDSGRSNSHGSVKLIWPCCRLAPARTLMEACQPRPRKLFCERSIVPRRPSDDEKPPPIENSPVGRSVTSTLTMIFVNVDVTERPTGLFSIDGG